MTETIARGGFRREYTEVEVIEDEDTIEYLKKVIGEKPEGPGEAAGGEQECEEGEFYSADFSSTSNEIKDLAVSEDGSTAVLFTTEV